MNLDLLQLARLLIHEAFLSKRWVVGLGVFIMTAILGVGAIWPDKYVASTTILVEDKNIIQPLMQGAAVATDATDRARIAREVIYGRKMMNRILKEAGWLKRNPGPAEQEKLIKDLIEHTDVVSVGRDLIKIEYRDSDPARAHLTAKRYAEMFITESLTAKTAESKSAFDFIDKQVQEYHVKLRQAEEALKEFRSANVDAQPGAEADVGARLNALQARIEQATQQLRETEIKEQSLEKQLSGEAEVSSVMTREGQYRSRLAEMQSQLDTLRLSFHDTYPDIVRLRHQMEDLNEAVAVERRRRETAKAAGRAELDDAVVNNPMYQQLKQELSQTRVQRDMFQARIAEARRDLQQELDRGKRVQGGTVTLAELTRDYQVNRDLYQDLVKRRESARVSMNIDRDNQGLTFKIQEPATLPMRPVGVRFWHIIVGGALLAIVTPFGLLYLKLKIDPRIRLPALIPANHGVPVLSTVPHMWSPLETLTARRDVAQLAMITALTMVLAAFVGLLRLARVF